MTLDKMVLITGVSGGLGGKMARFLLRKGWAVHGLSRRQPDIEDANFCWHKCNITDAEAVASLVARLPPTFDAVVHTAAVTGGVGPGLYMPLDAWRDAFEVNFFAALNITKQMIPNCWPNACFIFLSGGGSVTPRALVGPYAVSKLAVIKLAEQLTLEYPNFRFYAMAPGAHDTELFREQHRLSHEALPRFAQVADVERLLERFVADTDGRLKGKLFHVRDDIEQVLSVPDGGNIRRVERR